MNNWNLLKRFFTHIVVFVSLFWNPKSVFGQHVRFIDSQFQESVGYFSENKFTEALELINKADSLSVEVNYSRGIVTANIYRARIFLEQGEYDKAFFSLDKAKKQPSFEQDNYLISEFYRIRGRLRATLKLHKYALEDFRQQLFYSKKITNTSQRSLGIFFSYQNLVQAFEQLHLSDSVNVYLVKQEQSLNDLDNNVKSYTSITTYSKIAQHYIDRGDLSKALFYNKKAEDLAVANKQKQRDFIYETYAIIERKKGAYDKAGEYYEKAFFNAYELGLKDWARYYALEIKKFYADKDHQKSLKYFDIATSLDNDIGKGKQYVTDKLVEDLILATQEEQSQRVKWVILVSVSVFILLTLLVIYWVRQYRLAVKKRELAIEKSRELTRQAVQERLQMQVEKTELEQDLFHKKFKSLLELAKSNSSEFIVLFKELYPQATANFMELNPQMRNSEFRFCALAYLNFSTKEISQYTYVTISAVQSRKNRFRKKYGITSDVDFNQWIQQIGNHE